MAPPGDKCGSSPKLNQSEVIRNENPELSKVLSEEPSTGELLISFHSWLSSTQINMRCVTVVTTSLILL